MVSIWRLEDKFQELVLTSAEAGFLLFPLLCCILQASQPVSYSLVFLALPSTSPQEFWDYRFVQECGAFCMGSEGWGLVTRLVWLALYILSHLMTLFWSLTLLTESQADLELVQIRPQSVSSLPLLLNRCDYRCVPANSTSPYLM